MALDEELTLIHAQLTELGATMQRSWSQASAWCEVDVGTS